MQQIAIHLPLDILGDVDKIIEARHGEGDRTAVIRELLRVALAARSRSRAR